MKHVFRQWLAGLLSVVLLFTLLPAAALAEEAGGTTGQTAVEQVQALIDELPDAETITADNRADVEAQLSAIDEAKLALEGEELDELDFTRYVAAVEAILALDGMSGEDKPATIAVEAMYDVTGNSVVIDGDGECTITGTTDSNTITVTGGNVKITLEDVSVISNDCAFDIQKGNVTLILAGNIGNTFESGNYYAGIHVAAGASLTITGDGTLTAVSRKVPDANDTHNRTIGAGIGGNGEIGGPINGTTGQDTGDNAGDITIESGTIYATSEGDGAGIGGGWTSGTTRKNGQFKSITINGGTVTAESERNGAGIGSGCWASGMGTINITGGEIHAKTAADAKDEYGNRSHDIGAGYGMQGGGAINITGGVVYTEGEKGTGIGFYTGNPTLKDTIIFSHDGKGQVYGNVTLNSDLTIENDQTLHIPEGSSLTVSENCTLTVKDNATLENDGVLDNEGVLNNEGTVKGGGTLTGSGQVIGNPITYYFAAGEGTSESPYQIRNLEELEAFRDFINARNDGGEDRYFKLTQDIDMSSRYGPQKSWTPIGLSSSGFCGTFDGGGHTISGLYINNQDQYSDSLQGLFANNAGTISSLNVSVNFKGTTVVGGIVCDNRGTIKDCTSDGTVTVENAENVDGIIVGGGIVGMNSGVVMDCSSTAHVAVTVDGSEAKIVMYGAGGIVGITGDNWDTQTRIENCAFSGEVTGSASGGAGTQMIMAGIGGVVGMNEAVSYAVTVERCSNSGAVSGSGSGGTMAGVGGIMGLNVVTSGTAVVKNCLNTGAVSDGISGGINGAGGIVGANLSTIDPKNAEVENCCNTGIVTVTGNAASGAVVGMNSTEMEGIPLSGTVTNCYYLAADDTPGIGGDGGNGEAILKTADQFASGEVAYLLQKEQGTQVWGQTVNSGIPELTDSAEKIVYKITGVIEDQESVVWYSNNEATLPTAPEKEGYTFAGWSTTEGGSVDFNAGATVSGDMTVYAIFTEPSKRVDGTGSVTMADYTCGDDSVEPVVRSETNGTENVTFSYKAKGAPDSDYTSKKPLTAGEYTVRAVFAATDDYNEVTATADFRITHKFPANLEEDAEFSCGCLCELRLEAERLTQVPEELRDIYSDVETLTRAMVRQLSARSNYAVYDVKLEVRQGAGAWQDAPEGSIPDEGITVTLPYPQGTDAGYVFTVVHMFAYGDRAGETETPAVTNTARGITFTVTGLSPVCVGWTYPYPVYPGPAAPSTPHYGVTTPNVTSGGGVSVSPKSAQPGTKVTLTVTPEVGHHLGTLSVKDSAGRAVEVTDNGDGTYTFTMPYGQVNVSTSFVECSSLNFTDLNITAWYHGYTDYVLANGLMHGKGNNRFAPEGTVTRAEMVTTLWNLRGNPVVNYYMTYDDVGEESWYSEAVRWASSEKIAQGYGNGKFGPNDAITREQMAVMLYRYEQKYGSGGFTGAWMYLMPFDDLESISDWAFEAVAWCNMRGVIEGKSGNIFDPKGLARRSELAAVLTRYGTEE